MPAKYIIDTCIWRDFYENRTGFTGNPLGKYASEMFMLIVKKNHKVLFSKCIIWELKKDHKEEEINNMLGLLAMNNILARIDITDDEYNEARNLSQKRNLPLVDCLIAVQARNHNAVIISNDKHFDLLSDIAIRIRPNELR